MISHVEIYINDWKQELKFWNKIKDILNLEILHIWKTGFSVGDKNNYISFNQVIIFGYYVPCEKIFKKYLALFII